ncbi:MAG TPA: translocation/assembly module TamB domain-containing protein [Candidatus Acidoferrales bacterium]|nr:translocation/assembly module TamB domain-containing protein [Candidatus Acidoferrales bacterium]
MKRWAVRVFLGLVLLVVVVIVFFAVILNTGTLDRWARSYIVKKIDSSLATQAQLQGFHFQLRGLTADLDGLTIHGREGPGLPPFFHADHIRVGVHIISLLHHKISLSDVEITQPSIFIRVDENGKSNVPVPPRKQPSKPWQTQLFDLQIAQLKISNGTMLFNDAKIPLDVEGQNFEFAMNYQAAPLKADSYFGQLQWKQVDMTARRYMPFRFDIGTKFTLTRTAVSVDDFQLKLPHTTLNARAEIKSFQPLDADFHYRGVLSLPDLRTILRKTSMPDGDVDLNGSASYAQHKFQLKGDYHARGLVMSYSWFHAKDIESWGDVDVADNHLRLPVFHARAFGGTLVGKLSMDFKGLAFRTDTKVTGASLAVVLSAVNNPSMPVRTLHWDGILQADTICTWNRDFKHFAVNGVTVWSPPVQHQPGLIPATSHIKFDYVMDRGSVALEPSTITTPNSRLDFNGTLARRNSDLQAKFHTARIEDWSDFISDLRGNQKNSEPITGSADWNGNLSGPLTGPTFAGSFHAQDAHFGRMYWDDITGSMVYSPRNFTLTNAVVKRGASQANLDLSLALHKWSFPKNGGWSLRAQLNRASLTDLQGLFGTSYPATAILTANFQGSGTRQDPVLDGNFDLQDMTTYGIHVDRARGALSLRHDQIKITNAVLDRGSGHLTGNLLYHTAERTVEFQTIGTGISLSEFNFLQGKSLPIGGDIDFDLRGSGPITSPQAHGTVQLVDLRFGSEVLDSFSGSVDSNGQAAELDLQSTRTRGKLLAHFRMGLSDNYPLDGKITVRKIDLDPFISAGLHLNELTGHSSIDGELTISGQAKEPDTIVMQADLSQITFDYEFVKLHNTGPVRLTYGHNEVHLEPATLSGTDTNFQISGDARFSGNRELNLKVAGSINLRLVNGLFTGLDARGVAQLNTTIAGTFSNPQVIGQAKIVNASAHYSDFPAGISSLNGDVVFDRSRMLLNNFTAQAGGGTLKISGNVGYGAKAVTYELDATASSVRVRYPQGMSWLLDGNIRFAGTGQGAVLSGDATVQRVVFAPDVDFSSMLIASTSVSTLNGPATSSAYLRNLQFDISARAVQGMQIVWGTAHFTAEGGVRVRGTWEHPIVLGSIHLLSGEMAFHGNTYRLSRGDINFSDPFHFNPVLNIEVATTINPYEITLDFTGKASHIQLAYRSDPPLQSTDIINLLALGSQGEQSGLTTSSSSQAQNFQATSILSEAITSQIGAPVERLFGVTNFRIDPFLATSLVGSSVTQTTEARVTIQKQVTRDLSITYSTNAASNQQQVIEVDYAVHRNITIVALRDINGIYGISVKFTNHFR